MLANSLKCVARNNRNGWLNTSQKNSKYSIKVTIPVFVFVYPVCQVNVTLRYFLFADV